MTSSSSRARLAILRNVFARRRQRSWVAGMSADMQAAGVGPAATRKALRILQVVFSCAVTWGHLQHNPVVGVRKPSGKRKRAVVPPFLVLVERMRAELLGERQLRDATLVALLAYAGRRPQEARAAVVPTCASGRCCDRAQCDEGVKGTKSSRTRSVRLLAPLATDLAAWRLASGRPDGAELVFPTSGGELWRDHDWRNWRRRVFDPLAARRCAGHASVRPVPRVLLAADRGGHVCRGRAPGRSRADDDARYVRARHGRSRSRRAGVRGGGDPGCAGG
jgi:integrase